MNHTKTIKYIINSYKKTVWKSKFIFILFFWLFVSFIVVIEPFIFTKIIILIENYFKTWIFDRDWTIKLIISWGIFIFFSIFMQYVYDYFLVWKTVLQNYVDESNKYSKKIISMNYPDYLGKQQWKLYKIFDRWIDSQFKFLYFLFIDLLRSWTAIIIVIIIMFSINWLMALIALSMIPVMTFIWVFFINKLSPYQRELDKKWESIYWKIWNILSWFMLTKALTLESYYYKNIKNKLSQLYIEQKKITKYWSISTVYTNMVVMISRIMVLWFGVFFVIRWNLSFAELFLFFSYIWWIYFPLGFIFSKLRDSTIQLVWVEKLYNEFHDLELENITKWVTLKNIKWNIEYKDVEFWYSKNINILNKISFSIKSWESIAFVWNTWAWKSTIINLLLRLWDIDNWKILIDWKNIIKISKKSIRNHIWIVTQDVSLFNDTILVNLLYANPKASEQEIVKALKKSEANFVFNLKDWINTVIWERWLKLSWWEKQRLSIARLFLKNPEILILDEATSALDNKTEKLIQKALDKLMKWRTSIVIAHRLSTIQNADRIFMIENWKIIETGKYDELVKNKWKFYGLVNPEHLILN